MSIVKYTSPLRAVLAIIIGVFAALIFVNMNSNYAPPTPSLEYPFVDQEAQGTAQEPDVSLDQYASIVARPLFVPTRRIIEAPVPPPAVTTPTAQARVVGPSSLAAINGLILRGVLISEEARQAVIEHEDSFESEIVEVGYVQAGWRLTRIDERSVVFSNGVVEHRLALWVDEAAPQQ